MTAEALTKIEEEGFGDHNARRRCMKRLFKNFDGLGKDQRIVILKRLVADLLQVALAQ